MRSPFSKQAEPLCEALIPRIHWPRIDTDLLLIKAIKLGEEFQETLVSLSCFLHVLFVTLRERGYVALAERAHLSVGHDVTIATAANYQILCLRLSGVTSLRRFNLNQSARHWQCIDGAFVDSLHYQLKLAVIKRSARRFFDLCDSLSQTLL